MITFQNRTKPNRKKIKRLDTNETYDVEFLAPSDPGTGAEGTALTAENLNDIAVKAANIVGVISSANLPSGTSVTDATTTVKGIATIGASGGAARYQQAADLPTNLIAASGNLTASRNASTGAWTLTNTAAKATLNGVQKNTVAYTLNGTTLDITIS